MSDGHSSLTLDRVSDEQLELARSMLDPYSSLTGEFDLWLNKFEYVADVVGIPDSLMRQFFFKMVKDDIFTTRKCFPSREKLSNLSYERILWIFHYFFSRPFHTFHLHRRRFSHRNQYENEIILQFAKNLNKIYAKCEYDLPHHILRRQFISGIRDNDIKSKLMELDCYTFNELLPIAEILEEKIRRKGHL